MYRSLCIFPLSDVPESKNAACRRSGLHPLPLVGQEEDVASPPSGRMLREGWSRSLSGYPTLSRPDPTQIRKVLNRNDEANRRVVSAMTLHERKITAPIDPVKLDRLAEVAIKRQDLLLTAPTACAAAGTKDCRPCLQGRRWSGDLVFSDAVRFNSIKAAKIVAHQMFKNRAAPDRPS
jgi:hypothetical protein